MRLFEAIEGLSTEVNDDGLTVKVKNKFEALRLRNRIERQGYAVELENNKNYYIIRIWGARLGDAYLLRNNEGTAI